jgi:hypothetical protein
MPLPPVLTRQRWWLVLLGLALLAFSLAMLFQPTVGRGGR